MECDKTHQQLSEILPMQRMPSCCIIVPGLRIKRVVMIVFAGSLGYTFITVCFGSLRSLNISELDHFFNTRVFFFFLCYRLACSLGRGGAEHHYVGSWRRSSVWSCFSNPITGAGYDHVLFLRIQHARVERFFL